MCIMLCPLLIVFLMRIMYVVVLLIVLIFSCVLCMLCITDCVLCCYSPQVRKQVKAEFEALLKEGTTRVSTEV